MKKRKRERGRMILFQSISIHNNICFFFFNSFYYFPFFHNNTKQQHLYLFINAKDLNLFNWIEICVYCVSVYIVFHSLWTICEPEWQLKQFNENKNQKRLVGGFFLWESVIPDSVDWMWNENRTHKVNKDYNK